KIKQHENALSTLKQGYLEKQEGKLDEVGKQMEQFEKKLSALLSSQQSETQDIKQLTSHANETSSALAQYKDRINELERQLLSQNRKFDEIVKLKSTLETLAKAMQAKEECKT